MAGKFMHVTHGKLNLVTALLALSLAAAAAAAPVAPQPAAPAEFWAFRPVADPPAPAVNDAAWAKSPLDQFVLAKLEAAGLKPAPPADKRALVRRATFDLTGLPPTPEEVEAFLADGSPEAFAKVVERLLASPAYGERWGRHWLDVARYADSNGLDENQAYGNAWRYRDYVIAAFNADKPYDQFLLEQIAGDLLPSPDMAGRHERLIATGFLSLGPKVLAEPDGAKMEMDIVDEQVDTLGRAVMALTVGCARCHDHKFDPISIDDYYGLAGIFKSTKSMETFTKIARWHENEIVTEQDLAAKAAHEQQVAQKRQAVADVVNAANEKLKAASTPPGTLPADPEAAYPQETKDELARLRAELAQVEAAAPVMPSAMGVTEGTVADVPVHVRGSHLSFGAVVPRRFPRVLAGENQTPMSPTQSGRLELAQWLTRPDHPLTSRVMVNRIWRWHFGEGIVRSPDNFGKLGETPDNPELLDWLARRFVESGWSVKAMHRLIMLSSTYQMGSAHDARAAEVDPDNRLHWRAEVRRLEAEAVRDSILFVSGTLDRTAGGPAITHVKNREFLFDHTSKDGTRYDSLRRSVYLPVVRNHLYDVFQLLDYPDPAVPNGDRSTTTTAPQALLMMNSEFVLAACEALAGALLNGPDADDAGRIGTLYLKCYGRPATDAEVARGLSLIERFQQAAVEFEPDAHRRRSRAWTWLCQVVVSANEFVYVN